jgi:hypothetical protein
MEISHLETFVACKVLLSLDGKQVGFSCFRNLFVSTKLLGSIHGNDSK